MKKYSVHDLVLTSLFIALVYIFTWVVKINFPFAPQGGLVHLGNVPFFLACIFFGKRIGMIAGAVGMGLFDVTSGWVAWAPITVITCLMMGYTLATFAQRGITYRHLVPAMFLLALLKIIGYYCGEVIIFHSFLAPLASIPGNLIQITVSSVIVLAVLEPVKHMIKAAHLG